MADLGSALQSVLQVPGLQELLNSSITRNRELEPLRTGVTQQAMNMLPNSAFGGGATSDRYGRTNIASIPRANYTTPPPSNSGGTDWTKVLSYLAAGVGGAGALARLLNGGKSSGGNLADIVNGLKKLFSHDPRFQGNKPYPGGALTGGGQPPQYPFPGWAGNEGMDFNQWPGGQEEPSPRPSVDTSYDFNNDPFFSYEPGGSNFVGPMLPGGDLNGGGSDEFEP